MIMALIGLTRRYLGGLLLVATLWGQEPEFDLVPQMIHEVALSDLAYAPDGRTFVSASPDLLIVWDVLSGRQKHVIPGMGRGFTRIDISPDGRWLAAGAQDQTLSIWSLETYRLVHVLTGHSYAVTDVAFGPDSRFLASVATRWAPEQGQEANATPSANGAVSSMAQNMRELTGSLLAGKEMSSELKLWDLSLAEQNRAELWSNSEGLIEPISFSPKGDVIACGSTKGTFGLIDVQGSNLQLFGQNNRLQALAFSPDGRTLAYAQWGKDKNEFPARGIVAWDLASQQELHHFSNYTGFVEALAFSPDGQVLATVANDFEVYLPPPGTVSRGVLPLCKATNYPKQGREGHKFSAHRDQVIAVGKNSELKINKHNTSGYKLGELKLWRAADGKDLGTLVRDSSPIYAVAFGPDGFLVHDSAGHTLKHWNTATQKETHVLQGLTSEIQDLVFSPDGKLLADVHGGNSFRVWDIDNLRRVQLFKGHQRRINHLAFSADSRLIASSSQDKTICIWDASSGDLLRRLECERSPRGLAFSPDNQYLVGIEWPMLGLRSLLHKQLVWWDWKKGTRIDFKDKQAWRIEKEMYNQVSFSPDGQLLLLSGGYRDLRRFENPSSAPTDCWSVATGKPVYRFASSDACALSDDGALLATARGNELITWEVASHRQRRVFSGHDYKGFRRTVKQELGITSVDISPDGAYLASCSQDKSLRLWDMQTGVQLHKLVGSFQLARFSPRGKLLVSSRFDGRLEIWDLAQLRKSKGAVRPVLTLIGQQDSEEFIAFTPDLKYKSTRNGYKAITIRKEDRVYNFDQFDAFLNRPDLVLAALPESNPKLVASFRHACERRLENLGIPVDRLALDFDLPRVDIISSMPQAGKTTNAQAQLRVKVIDGKHKLDRLLVWVNGIPIYGRNGKNLAALTSGATLEIAVDLSYGSNAIEVSAMNHRGVESYRQTVAFERQGQPPKPNLYIAAVGVSDYQQGDTQHDLAYAAKDAADVLTLMNLQKDCFGEVIATRLVDGQATRENILGLRSFFEQAGVHDTVVLFLAGHGLLDGVRDFYFGTCDIDFTNPAKRGFPYTELQGLMDHLATRRKLVLIDACHSGGLDKTPMPNQAVQTPPENALARGLVREQSGATQDSSLENEFDLVSELFVDLNRFCGTQVISSAQGNEFAYEAAQWQNGAFTSALLDALTTDKKSGLLHADRDQSRGVDIAELRAYTIAAVKILTNGEQRPTAREQTLNFDYALLQLPEEEPSFAKRLKQGALKVLAAAEELVARPLWRDELKPSPADTSYQRLIVQTEQSSSLEQDPEPGAFPAELTGTQAQKACSEPPFRFQGCKGVRKGRAEESADWVFSFTRSDGEEGLLYLAAADPSLSLDDLIQERLDFDYGAIGPVQKGFLWQGNSQVQIDTQSSPDRKQVFLVTRSLYTSSMGEMSRCHYHMLYQDKQHTYRLTTAGGHLHKREDTNTYGYSVEFDAVVRKLFDRLEVAQSDP